MLAVISYTLQIGVNQILPASACLFLQCLPSSFLTPACTSAQPCWELDWGTELEQNQPASTLSSLRNFAVLREEGNENLVDKFLSFSSSVGLLQLKTHHCDPVEYIEKIHLADPSCRKQQWQCGIQLLKGFCSPSHQTTLHILSLYFFSCKLPMRIAILLPMRIAYIPTELWTKNSTWKMLWRYEVLRVVNIALSHGDW